MSPVVSIVVPTLNEGDNVLDTADAVLRNGEGRPLELIVVDDGSTDHSLERLRRWRDEGRLRLIEAPRTGPARCRNRGAEAARGGLLVFMDAHCYAPPGWLGPLIEGMAADPGLGAIGPAIGHTGDFRLRGYGGTWRDDALDMTWLTAAKGVTEVPFQPAGCQMVRREVFREVGGYDEGMTRWGSEDVELCIRVWLFGHRIAVQPASTVYHLFRQSPPYDVDYPQVVYNKLRMILLHFDGERLGRVLRRQLAYAHVEHGLARLYTDQTRARREALFASRQHDMDWLCDRFGLVA